MMEAKVAEPALYAECKRFVDDKDLGTDDTGKDQLYNFLFHEAAPKLLRYDADQEPPAVVHKVWNRVRLLVPDVETETGAPSQHASSNQVAKKAGHAARANALRGESAHRPVAGAASHHVPSKAEIKKHMKNDSEVD